MESTATKFSKGKRITSILVAIAMVLAMSNISAYLAQADEAESDSAKSEEVAKIETTETTEKSDEDVKADQTDEVSAPEATEKDSDNDVAGFDDEVNDKVEAESDKSDSDSVKKTVKGASKAPAVVNETDEDSESDESSSEEAKTLTITYKAINGDFGLESDIRPATESTETITFTADRMRITPPTVGNRPHAGYEKGSWDPALPENNMIEYSDDGYTFTYTYVPAPTTYKVSFWNDDTNEQIGQTVDAEARYYDEIDVNTVAKNYPNPAGYAFTEATPSGTIKLFPDSGQNHEIKLYYSKDDNNDAVADKFQAIVTYTAQNGTIDGNATEVVTLYGTNGNPSTRGTGAVSKVPNVKPNKGYESGYWAVSDDEGEFTPVVLDDYAITGDIEFVYVCAPENTHRILLNTEYYQDGSFVTSVASVKEAAKVEPITIAYNGEGMLNDSNFFGAGYVFDEAIDSNGSKIDTNKQIELKSEEESLEIIIKVYYCSDFMGAIEGRYDRPDGIADKYQAKIAFAAQNCTFGGTSKSTVQVVTLRDKDGNLSENGTASVVTPSPVVPDEGYTMMNTDEYPVGWSHGWKRGDVITKDLISSLNGEAITFTCAPAPYDYKVYVLNNATGAPIDADNPYYDNIAGDKRYQETVNRDEVSDYIPRVLVGDENTPNYVFSHADRDEFAITTNANDNAMTLFYDIDANKDEIADKYQKTVTYTAINGTVSGTVTEYVTLYDQNGIPSESGTGTLAHNISATPYDGYGNGVWSPVNPLANPAITQNTNFVVTYSLLPVKNDDDSSNKGNNNNNNNNSSNAGNNNTNNGGGNVAGTTQTGGAYVPVINTGDQATADDDAINAPLETVVMPDGDVETTIEGDENPLAASPTSDDQTTIADDENALADYEASGANWTPYIILGAVVLALLFGIAVLARRKQQMDASKK